MDSPFADTTFTAPPSAPPAAPSLSSPLVPPAPPAPPAPPQPELLLSAALHLMSHYSAQANAAGACVKLASVIERHLKALAGHADLTPVLRATCEQLSEHWAGVEEASLAKSSPARARRFGWRMMGQH